MRSTPGVGQGARRAAGATDSVIALDLGPVAFVADLATCAAHAQCPVLITGETGVGKGLLARWIHERSGRNDKPFVPVNGAALPDSLIDSQLFGHVRGAFSGATSDQAGMVRAADTGTLFLDEVGDLPLSVQARLLRLLQEKEIQPVGLCRPVRVDVRVIAATNAHLPSAVAEGRFRQDLLFRLDVVRIELPSLRQCSDHIVPLAERFAAEFASMYGTPALRFDRSAKQLMKSAPWPGNVRQLRSVIERLQLFAGSGEVTADMVARIGRVETNGNGNSSASAIQSARLDITRSALHAAGGRVSRAADELGVHRSTVYRWLANERLRRKRRPGE